MTTPPIQDLGMTDTEYAALAAKGYDPNLEQRLTSMICFVSAFILL
jgi:hypothetical protein